MKHRPFEGEVYRYHFEIRRVVEYRNDFLPIVIGDIHSADAGSLIELTFKAATPLIVFMVMWLALTGIVGSWLLVSDARNGTLSVASLVPLGLFSLGCAGIVGFSISFDREVSKAKASLHELL